MRRRSKKARHYFTSETEEAILAYCNTSCNQVRTKLYVEKIQPAFNELVDKIVFTYKFTSLENIDPLKEECKIWLTTILGKFDPSQGTKAFSYFSVVTKNWFTHQAKKQAKKYKREVSYDTMLKEISALEDAGEESILDSQEREQFWTTLLTEVEKWSQVPLKPNEQKVIDAVLTLLNNVDQIEIFNKKAIYLYLREITGLNTKQIVSCLNKIRAKYRTFKQKWDDGEIM